MLNRRVSFWRIKQNSIIFLFCSSSSVLSWLITLHPTKRLSVFSRLDGGFVGVVSCWLEAHDAQVNSFSIPFQPVAMQLHDRGAWRPKVNRLYSVFAVMNSEKKKNKKRHAEPKAAESFIQHTGSFRRCVIPAIYLLGGGQQWTSQGVGEN